MRPIRDLSGDEHFNEVVFEDALLPADALIGRAGEGWQQVMAELAYERSGPERFLSSIGALIELIRVLGPEASEEAAAQVGRLTAQLVTLRKMSISVAGMLEAKRDPAIEAAVVKDLGGSFEQSTAGGRSGFRRARSRCRARLRSAAGHGASDAGRAVVLVTRRHARDPARHHCAGIGAAMSETAAILAQMVDRLFTDHVDAALLAAAAQGGWPDELWRLAEEQSLTTALVPEARGGMGASFHEVCVIARACGRHRVPVPLPETMAAALAARQRRA